jgi:DNA-binding response OmpR family regulator
VAGGTHFERRRGSNDPNLRTNDAKSQFERVANALRFYDETVRVLLVDDEVSLAESIAEGLRVEGFEVDLAHDGERGYELASDSVYDVIVLDIMLPKKNGYKVCAELRAAGVATPILMLTAKQGELDEAEALDTGADDFLSKPFAFVVLLARLRALTRRATALSNGGDRLQRGDLVIDARHRRCWRGANEIQLTARELDLLSAIVKASPHPVSKGTILEDVWGTSFEGDPNVVEVYVGYLRRKIDTPFQRTSLQTVRGVGYRFDAEK